MLLLCLDTKTEGAFAGSTSSYSTPLADAALILAGLSLFGLAVWFPPFSTTDAAPQAIVLWPFYALAGGLVLVALILGQRWDWVRIARLILFGALGVLVVARFRVRTVGLVAWLTLIIPGLVLLLTTPFFGPMPRAADETIRSRA